MDRPTPRERVEHVLKAINYIQEFTSETTLEQFESNLQLQSAVQFQFLIIGEAIRYIDESILSKYNYPWHIPRSFRNFIIHPNHGIKMVRIYNACQELEPLEKVMETILDKEF